ncbi:hypothetical protein KAI46_11470, partial [bacterium]|nr:hypothetical protein [bacterium]
TQTWSEVLTAPDIGKNTDGGGAAMADLDGNGRQELLFMAIVAPIGENQFHYRIGWNLNDQGIPDESWGDWVSCSDTFVGKETEGGGAAIGDINKDGTPDLLLMTIDNPNSPSGDNVFHYRIGWALNENGVPQDGWSHHEPKYSSLDEPNVGGGAALKDINGDGTLDLLLMGIDGDKEPNNFYYRVGWSLNEDGETERWGAKIQVEGVSDNTDGGGAALFDINGNGTMDLMLMSINDLESSNEFSYRIGWDINTYSEAANGWSDPITIALPEIKNYHAGGGISLVDINGNGRPELVLNGTHNDLQVMIAWDLDVNGKPEMTTGMTTVAGNGNPSSGGGTAIADLDDDGSFDLLVIKVDDLDDDDQISYRVLHNLVAADWGFPLSANNNEGWGNGYAGGGLAVADIDGNDIPDVVTMAITDECGDGDSHYRIGWNLNSDGLPASWGEMKTIPAISDQNDGGGLAIADIDGNGKPDLVAMGIHHDAGNQWLEYRIGWSLDVNGDPSWWSNPITIPDVIPNRSAGGGLAIGHIDDDDSLDMVLMYIYDENSTLANEIRYVFAYDLDDQGIPASYDGFHSQPTSKDTQGGGLALADLNGNGRSELVIMSVADPDGANYFNYRIGWDLPKWGDTDNWTRELATFKGQLYTRADGGGAAIADVTGNGKLDLLLLSVDDVVGNDRVHFAVGKNIETEATILARYRENFMLTGFSVQENHGCDVGVFHDQGYRDGTAKAYTYLSYEYLKSQTALADAYAEMKEEPYNLSATGKIEHCSHPDAAQQLVSDRTREILEKYSKKTSLPLIIAMTDTAADIPLESFTDDDQVVASGTSFTVDLTQEDPVTTRTLKMPWYDATTLDKSTTVIGCYPLALDQLIEIVEGWDFSEEEKENTLKHLLAWSMGEARISKIGSSAVNTSAPESEAQEALTWTSKSSMGLSALVMMPARLNGVGLFLRAWTTSIHGLAGSAKIGQSFYNIVKCTDKAKMTMIKSILGKDVSKSWVGKFGNLSRASKWLGRAGAVAAVGVILYSWGSVVAREGVDSDFGWGMGAFMAFLNAMYAGVLILVACIPFVGAVLTGMIVLSDIVVGVVKGSGWSQMAIQAIIDSLVHVKMVTGVDIVHEGSSTTVEDNDNNGLTTGDKFTYTADIKAVIYDENEATNANLDDTYICPSFSFRDSDDFSHTETSDCYKTINFNDERWDMYELNASLIPNKAKINLQATLQFSSRYRVVYKKCFVGSCDDEFETDYYSSNSYIYMDVLPNTLEDFLAWPEVTSANMDPWAQGESYEMLSSGGSLAVSAEEGLLANDYDIDGDQLQVKQQTEAEFGEVVINSQTGSFTYKPYETSF